MNLKKQSNRILILPYLNAYIYMHKHFHSLYYTEQEIVQEQITRGHISNKRNNEL